MSGLVNRYRGRKLADLRHSPDDKVVVGINPGMCPGTWGVAIASVRAVPGGKAILHFVEAERFATVSDAVKAMIVVCDGADAVRVEKGGGTGSSWAHTIGTGVAHVSEHPVRERSDVRRIALQRALREGRWRNRYQFYTEEPLEPIAFYRMCEDEEDAAMVALEHALTLTAEKSAMVTQDRDGSWVPCLSTGSVRHYVTENYPKSESVSGRFDPDAWTEAEAAMAETPFHQGRPCDISRHMEASLEFSSLACSMESGLPRYSGTFQLGTATLHVVGDSVNELRLHLAAHLKEIGAFAGFGPKGEVIVKKPDPTEVTVTLDFSGPKSCVIGDSDSLRVRPREDGRAFIVAKGAFVDGNGYIHEQSGELEAHHPDDVYNADELGTIFVMIGEDGIYLSLETEPDDEDVPLAAFDWKFVGQRIHRDDLRDIRVITGDPRVRERDERIARKLMFGMTEAVGNRSSRALVPVAKTTETARYVGDKRVASSRFDGPSTPFNARAVPQSDGSIATACPACFERLGGMERPTDAIGLLNFSRVGATATCPRRGCPVHAVGFRYILAIVSRDSGPADDPEARWATVQPLPCAPASKPYVETYGEAAKKAARLAEPQCFPVGPNGEEFVDFRDAIAGGRRFYDKGANVPDLDPEGFEMYNPHINCEIAAMWKREPMVSPEIMQRVTMGDNFRDLNFGTAPPSLVGPLYSYGFSGDGEPLALEQIAPAFKASAIEATMRVLKDLIAMPMGLPLSFLCERGEARLMAQKAVTLKEHLTAIEMSGPDEAHIRVAAKELMAEGFRMGFRNVENEAIVESGNVDVRAPIREPGQTPVRGLAGLAEECVDQAAFVTARRLAKYGFHMRSDAVKERAWGARVEEERVVIAILRRVFGELFMPAAQRQVRGAWPGAEA